MIKWNDESIDARNQKSSYCERDRQARQEIFYQSRKIMKRLQLTVLRCRKKMNRDIRATAVYILNNFKRAYSKIYFDFFASIQKKFRAADLTIRDIKLIKNFQINVFLNDDFVENFSVIASRVDIIKTNTSISSTRVVVFKFSILKVVFVISRKTSQAEKID